MGLFQKKFTNTATSAPLYTIGEQTAMLIVGLGNPGEKYAHSRHNVGFVCIDAFAKGQSQFSDWHLKKDLHCHITSGIIGSVKVLLIKPVTFMNESGRAVQAVQSFYKIPSEKTIVVHDELDIDFGQIRTRMGGGAAGHNGIKSIINHTGTEFGRIRIGINNDHKPSADTSDFVLKNFNNDEQKYISTMTKEVDTILLETIFSGNLSAETRNFIF